MELRLEKSVRAIVIALTTLLIRSPQHLQGAVAGAVKTSISMREPRLVLSIWLINGEPWRTWLVTKKNGRPEAPASLP
jgi:hypothetical protein